jgi:hypothetical protein
VEPGFPQHPAASPPDDNLNRARSLIVPILTEAEEVSAGMARIKAPRPPRPKDPWSPIEGKAPRPAPEQKVRVTALRAHMGPDAWQEVGSTYDVPIARAEQFAALGFVSFAAAGCDDWFEDEPPPDPTPAGRVVYDGSLGPDVRVRALEAEVPVSIPAGGIWFHRGHDGVFWIPSAAGEERAFPEAVAILLAATAACEIVDELSERGKAFVALRQTKLFGAFY